MKKISLILFVFLAFIPFYVFSYTPSSNDISLVEEIKTTLTKSTNNKSELWFKRNINSFDYFLGNYNKNDRIHFILSSVRSFLQEKLDEITAKKLVLIEQDKNIDRKVFFDTYGNNITSGLTPPNNCIIHFDFVDKIAKQNDFPTELVLATWGKEYNCNLGNPANGWGPFQITSQYYNPGDISLEEFGVSVQKYIDFTKGKWDYFNNNKYHNYKTRFGSENINITYDNYTIRDLKLTAILYNGVSSNTTLDGNTFANSNLNSGVTSNSDGIVTRFLKILNWRIENKN